MKNKKLIGLMLTLILVISAMPVYATNDEKPIDTSIVSYSEYEEITDIEELTHRAEQGITDISIVDLPALVATAKIKGNDESLSLEAIITCQILSEQITKDGYTEMTIVVTSIFGMDKEAFSSKSGGIDYNYKWDGSYGVKAYSSNYYSIDGNGEYRLDKITGGWIVSDSTLGIQNRHVVYGQSGFSSDAPGGYTQTNGSLSPSGNFSKTTGYVYHVNSGGYSGMGNTSTVEIFRWLNPSVIWELELFNSVF